ncbi:hypothetical protein [Rhodothermus profundi]|uniref:Oxygen tolerance n=1 Tax=Rhodothermus profundi TaxID=633813 RepID=A0A1M6RUN3_9BACT|nr:hypothetical protein [Rhodothermus profundi]SHK36110.1 hypothetical protein SAMN04488087_0967 [Rhodothermus profundi]
MNRLLFGLLLVLGPFPIASGQTRLEARLSADTVAIGERFTLTLLLERPAAARLKLPTDSLLGDLQVIEGPLRYSRPLDAGRLRDSIVYRVTTFVLDSARVPPLPLVLHTETEQHTLTTPPLQVIVRSVVPPDATGIRDLAPIVAFPAARWPWLAGAALLALLLGLAAYLWFRRRPSSPPFPPPPPEPRPDPYRLALQRLQELEAVTAQSSSRRFYIALADVLRGYLEDRLQLPARRMTTRELTTRLAQHPSRPIAGLATPIRQVLETADLAKFAGRTYPPDYNRQVLSVTRTLIERLELSGRVGTSIQPDTLTTHSTRL